MAREVAAPGVRAGAGSREDARSSHQPSTRLARSPPWASVSLQERPDLRSLPPDLSTEVGDLKCKGKSMVGFGARKEIGDGEDGDGG